MNRSIPQGEGKLPERGDAAVHERFNPRDKKAAGHFCRAAWLRFREEGLRGFCCECLLRLCDDGGKSGGISDRKIGEDLAVGFDAGGFQAFDET